MRALRDGALPKMPGRILESIQREWKHRNHSADGGDGLVPPVALWLWVQPYAVLPGAPEPLEPLVARELVPVPHGERAAGCTELPGRHARVANKHKFSIGRVLPKQLLSRDATKALNV